jgi:hypothetical protein
LSTLELGWVGSIDGEEAMLGKHRDMCTRSNNLIRLYPTCASGLPFRSAGPAVFETSWRRKQWWEAPVGSVDHARPAGAVVAVARQEGEGGSGLADAGCMDGASERAEVDLERDPRGRQGLTADKGAPGSACMAFCGDGS